MQQYFQISKSLQGLQRFDESNPAPATRIRFSKAFFIVFVRFSKIDVGIVVADGRNSDLKRLIEQGEVFSRIFPTNNHWSAALFPTNLERSEAFFGTTFLICYVFTGDENVAR